MSTRTMALLAALSISLPQPAHAFNMKLLQARYCAGMEMEKYVSGGGRVDCLNDEFAIEVEWVQDWYHAIGQALYYAVATNRKPGIILLCPFISDAGEGLCRSYLYRLDMALTLVAVPVKVWECFPEDLTLGECFVPELTGPASQE